MNLDQQDPSASGSADPDPSREKTRKRKRIRNFFCLVETGSNLYIWNKNRYILCNIYSSPYTQLFVIFYSGKKNDFWNIGSGSKENNAGSAHSTAHRVLSQKYTGTTDLIQRCRTGSRTDRVQNYLGLSDPEKLFRLRIRSYSSAGQQNFTSSTLTIKYTNTPCDH